MQAHFCVSGATLLGLVVLLQATFHGASLHAQEARLSQSDVIAVDLRDCR